jgi:hypothetical protein
VSSRAGVSYRRREKSLPSPRLECRIAQHLADYVIPSSVDICIRLVICRKGYVMKENVWVCTSLCRLRLKRDGTRAETGFRLSPKRTSPFKSAGASVQSTADSRGVRVSGSNAGYTTFRGTVRVLATHSIRQFPLHFHSHASPCAITFQKHFTTGPS